MEDEGRKGNDMTGNTLRCLADAYQQSILATSSTPGNIPQMLTCAIRYEFESLIRRRRDVSDASDVLEDAQKKFIHMLDTLPPFLSPRAESLIARARKIMCDGPELSMNVDLTAGQVLPEQLHTLLQGTLWAVLMHSGADPDVLNRERKRTYPDKAPWFLCKKFFFVHQVAEKDGIVKQYHHFRFLRRYAGRLFARYSEVYLDPPDLQYTWRRMPPITDMHSNHGSTLVATTPKGIYVWGSCENGQLGVGEGRADVALEAIRHPVRLRFPACPDVAKYESNLPAWHKDRLVVGIHLTDDRSFLLTPVGLVVAGRNTNGFLGQFKDGRLFNQIALPSSFVPDTILSESYSVVLTSGSHQLIAGLNSYGQLGLGHCKDITGFQALPFHVDVIFGACEIEYSNFEEGDEDGLPVTDVCSVFLSGPRVLFAGEVPVCIAQARLLPGFSVGDVCSTATPLVFPCQPTSLFYDPYSTDSRLLCWTCGGQTHVSRHQFDTGLHEVLALPFEATELITGDGRPAFKDSGGKWFSVSFGGDVAKMSMDDLPMAEPKALYPLRL
ncbi:hypothetical protein J8273_3287 [Carpediemonas membranifera]|uniref:Uncharacterized protein n=1 Tax=Carpediemonas membranifera TaxID=201153 RepID=A0A8J6E186_9EUKA|nr:hypothetical protein J8273_3287 [Carpediemonas membranifera]|eukprot:KAG9393158.1 hypothetical protein J8273_3287 [Carpediemonas membranifera]